MFKILFTLIMLLVILMAGASYVSYLKTGTAFMPDFASEVDNINMPPTPSLDSFEGIVDLSSLLQKFKSDGSEESNQDKLTAIDAPSGLTYKWVENGAWHYGDKPPENVNAQLLVGDR